MAYSVLREVEKNLIFCIKYKHIPLRDLRILYLDFMRLILLFH